VDCGGCTVVQLCRLWVHALAVFNIYVRPRLQNVSSLQTERAICKLSRRLPVCKKRLPVCKLSRRLHVPVCKLRHIVCKLGTSLQTKRGSYTALPVCALTSLYCNQGSIIFNTIVIIMIIFTYFTLYLSSLTSIIWYYIRRSR
jgi:hypothetical protein